MRHHWTPLSIWPFGWTICFRTASPKSTLSSAPRPEHQSPCSSEHSSLYLLSVCSGERQALLINRLCFSINSKEVFCKVKASGLPSLRDHNCAIDLLPGTTSSIGRVYPLSHTEHQAIQEYIVPSTSLASASSFFIKKKGGGL